MGLRVRASGTSDQRRALPETQRVVIQHSGEDAGRGGKGGETSGDRKDKRLSLAA